MIPSWPALARYCSTSSTSARSSSDLGLALALDCQRGLRNDLRILPMSATLDSARLAQLLGGAPVIASEGRTFPVETCYLGRDATARVEDQMAQAVMRSLGA